MLLCSQWEHYGHSAARKTYLFICEWMSEMIIEENNRFLPVGKVRNQNNRQFFFIPLKGSVIFAEQKIVTNCKIFSFQSSCCSMLCCEKVFGLWSSHPGSVQSDPNCDGVQTVQRGERREVCLSLSVSTLQSSQYCQSAQACSALALPIPGREFQTLQSHRDRRDLWGLGAAPGPARGPGAG